MPGWTTNEDLALIAHRLGTAVMAMYDKAGITVSLPAYPGGTPSPDSRQTFVNSFIADAEDFMSVEPQKVHDEFSRMLQEGTKLNLLGITEHANGDGEISRRLGGDKGPV
ncbi:MAG TPA: hypothetical protein VGR06_00430 [Actinophytocola sp.]|jgi:hypothetical protein|uniref:hypothetical protein n=1 Tax=Actinophytocola sp. TaxID=1872138 RepID=UPI002E075C46|nr:hypothetical protein [Actinophytocola sp.]